ncbi:MAG: type II secretion system protein GspK [Candidatus Omnitrophica bacterium]|nr:type II secretion system protein GspK [Candidatus Omnitrophota bacterium]
MKKNGAILVTSLWIVTIVSLVALGVGFRSSLEMRLTRYSFDSLEAVYLARAGIVKTLSVLSLDTRPEYDSAFECGISMPEDETVTLTGLFGPADTMTGGGTFSVYDQGTGGNQTVWGPADEERRFNINYSKSTAGNLEEYRRMFGLLSPDMTPDIINAVIDWQDQDSNALPGGAEDADYERDGLMGAKDGDFETVEELALVKGVTRELYNDIKKYITVYGDGKININTAPFRVLAAVIGDGTGQYDELIANIIRTRAGPDGIEGTRDDAVFTDMTGVIATAKENFERQRLTSLAGYFKFTSNVFRIVTHGTVRRIDKDVTCVYDRKSAQEFVLKYYEEE